jgi:hypothetical protein
MQRPGIALLLVSLTACASTSAGSVMTPDASPAPRLISCPQTASLDQKNHSSVELRYTVNAEGSVEQNSIRLVPNMNASSMSDAAVNAARAMAVDCRYEPAVVNGRATAATTTRWFTVSP